ncbi:MAG: FHA domain-containing protein [Sandaracinaceae bacterium]|nr:FHA domain-containing protein [Sandaracinaceae bacterium]
MSTPGSRRSRDGGLRLIDLGSANGVRLNGQDVQNALLGAGDVVELGQVRFRFVAAGEHYAFDADRTVQMDAVAVERPSSNRTPILFAGLIVVVAVIGAGVVALWGGDDPEPTVRPLDEQSTARADDLAPQPAAGPSYDDALAACRAALAQAQIANAVAQADVALSARPGDPDATACRTSATAPPAAAADLRPRPRALPAGAPAGGLLRVRQPAGGQPLPLAAAGRAGGAGLRQRADRRGQPDHGRLARRGAAARAVRAGHGRDHAEPALHRLGHRARGARARRGERGRDPAAAAGRGRPPAAPGHPAGWHRAQPAGPEPAGRRRHPGERWRLAAGDRDPHARGRDRGAGAGITPAELDARVRQALISGNNTEVIRLLEGNARTEWQLQTLIETYRARGQTQQALRHMRTYVGRFSNTPRARQYQQILNSHGQ